MLARRRLVLVAAVIGVVLLAGGGGDDDDPATSSTPVPAETTTPAIDAPTTTVARTTTTRPSTTTTSPPTTAAAPPTTPRPGTVMLELDDDDTIPTGNSEILAELTATLAALPLVRGRVGGGDDARRCGAGSTRTPGAGRGRTFAIADGMGGRGGGAMAARLAIDRFLARLARRRRPPRLAGDRPRRQRRRRDRRPNARGWTRVGTTLLAAVVAGPVVTLVHVGDSRAYRLTPHPTAPAGAPPRASTCSPTTTPCGPSCWRPGSTSVSTVSGAWRCTG